MVQKPKKYTDTQTEISQKVQEATIAKETKEHKRLFQGQFPIVNGGTKLKKGIHPFPIYRESELEMVLPKTERFLS